MKSGLFHYRRGLAAGLLACLAAASPARADEACGLCAATVVLNSDLAGCFLDNYSQFAGEDGAAIAVDLSACGSRGIVEALPAPSGTTAEPDTQFMISRPQLACLKKKLEEPGLVLDPSATIELDDCR